LTYSNIFEFYNLLLQTTIPQAVFRIMMHEYLERNMRLEYNSLQFARNSDSFLFPCTKCMETPCQNIWSYQARWAWSL